jgi:hypothetical protein
MIVDSTESVMKNQKIPKAISRRPGEENRDLEKRYIPRENIDASSRNDKTTCDCIKE